MVPDYSILRYCSFIRASGMTYQSVICTISAASLVRNAYMSFFYTSMLCLAVLMIEELVIVVLVLHGKATTNVRTQLQPQNGIAHLLRGHRSR